jgi:hypothetical protein
MVHVDDLDNPALEELCAKAMRQTDYDVVQAREKLLEYNLDLTAVIRDYLNPPPKVESEPKSLNQRIYKEIRTFMDTMPRTNAS